MSPTLITFGAYKTERSLTTDWI